MTTPIAGPATNPMKTETPTEQIVHEERLVIAKRLITEERNYLERFGHTEAEYQKHTCYTAVLDELCDRDALQARVTALEAALAWAESTAVNLYCALQSTAHMDPNDRRIPTITGQVVRDLIVVRDRAREALTPAQPEGGGS